MKITGLEETRKGRISVIADGEFVFSVHRDTFLTTELRQGLEITEERLEEIREQDAFVSAREKAFSLLDRREYTARLLREKLRESFEEEPARAAVERMQELGLVDDADYARRLASDLFHLRHYPRRRVELELSRRGISREITEEVLSGFSEESEAETAAGVLLKKYGNRLNDKKEIDRAIAAMLRRGFTMDSIREALPMVLEEVRREVRTEESEDMDFD